MTGVTTSPKRIAQRISALERWAARGNVSQLGHSSFEGGGITQYSADGTTILGRYGDQFDGTGGLVAFNGPPPPTPANFTVLPALGALIIRWEGEWEDDGSDRPVVAPLNFTHVEVHTSTDPAFSGLMGATKRSEITSARGGEAIVQANATQTWYVRLVARNNAGQASSASVVIGPVTPLNVTDYSGTTVFYGTVQPTTVKPDLWLKQISAGPPPKYETWRFDPGTSTWVKLADQGATDALATAVAAQAAADTKAKIFNQNSMPTWTGAAGTAVWFDADDGNKPYNFNGTTFVPMLLGNGAISPNSLVASQVVVTGTITAALFEALMILTNTIIAGNPNGAHVLLDATGVYAFAVDPLTGLPYIATRLGTVGDDFVGVTGADGAVKGGIDSTGLITGRAGAFSESVTIGGRTLTTILGDGPRGLVTWGTISGGGVATAAERGDCAISFVAKAGRAYQIMCGPVQMISTVSGDYCQMTIRYTTNGIMPTTSSSYIGFGICQHGNTTQIDTLIQNSGAVDYVMVLLITHQRQFGSGNVTMTGTPGYVQIIDIGPTMADAIVTGGGGAGTLVTRTDSFAPTWWHVYNGSSALISMGNDLYQGYETTNGNTKSMVGFPDLTATLTGATVQKMWVELLSEHWWYADGGFPYIGVHPNLANTTTWPSGATGQFAAAKMGRGDSKWIELPLGWYANFKSGAYRGLVFGPGPGTNDRNYYGRYDAPSMRLHVQYTK